MSTRKVRKKLLVVLGTKASVDAAVVDGVVRVDAGGELAHAADGVDGEVRQQDDHRKLEHELDEVGPEHGPQAGDGVVGKRKREADEDGGELRARGGEAKREREHLDHGEVYPAHDDGVDRQRKIKRAEAAKERGGGLAGVAQLGEFDIGEHLRAAPQRREEENRQHAR